MKAIGARIKGKNVPHFLGRVVGAEGESVGEQHGSALEPDYIVEILVVAGCPFDFSMLARARPPRPVLSEFDDEDDAFGLVGGAVKSNNRSYLSIPWGK